MSTPDTQEGPVRVVPTGKRGGVWITLGDEQYRVAPLGLGTLRDPDFGSVLTSLGSIRGLPTPAQIDNAITFLHAALIRNYPAMTNAEVEAMIDLGNLQEILSATLGVSGFKPNGEKVSGEATASTGTVPTSP